MSKNLLIEVKPAQLFNMIIDNSVIDEVNKLFFSFRREQWLNYVREQFNADITYYRKEVLLNHDGYFFHREYDNIGLVALTRMAFTVGLMVDIDFEGKCYYQRYCYPSLQDAYRALETWDGQGLPPGNWIKRKGEGGDFSNPNLAKEI